MPSDIFNNPYGKNENNQNHRCEKYSFLGNIKIYSASLINSRILDEKWNQRNRIEIPPTELTYAWKLILQINCLVYTTVHVCELRYLVTDIYYSNCQVSIWEVILDSCSYYTSKLIWNGSNSKSDIIGPTRYLI